MNEYNNKAYNNNLLNIAVNAVWYPDAATSNNPIIVSNNSGTD